MNNEWIGSDEKPAVKRHPDRALYESSIRMPVK